jgi:NAD(P)-dependent dehydrogenase (short-subunit alcohol dehydrogenase family)
MLNALSGKTALISGAGRGLGRAQALLMAERGADIAVVDINAAAAAEVAAEIRALGRRAYVGEVDVADIQATANLVDAVDATLGGVDILVNNAGISGRETPLAAIDEVTFDRMFGVHVKGAFFLTQRVVQSMIKRGNGGRVINISSNRGIFGHSRSSHYAAAKAALIGLTKAWARELGPHRILVNAVAPGVVLTDMTAVNGLAPVQEEANFNVLKRWAEPIEIAYVVAFLASAEASFMTGQVLNPNGGDPIGGT